MFLAGDDQNNHESVIMSKQPIYKFDNKSYILKSFSETKDGLQLVCPVFVGKYHKCGGRELALQALKHKNSNVVVKLFQGLIETTINLPNDSSYLITRKLVDEPGQSDVSNTRSAAFQDIRMKIFEYENCVMSAELTCINSDDDIEINGKIIMAELSSVPKPTEDQFMFDIFQTFSLKDRRSRNWMPFFSGYEYVKGSGQREITSIEGSLINLPLQELTFKVKLTPVIESALDVENI